MSVNKSRSMRKKALPPRRSSRNVYRQADTKKSNFSLPSLPSLPSVKGLWAVLLCAGVGMGIVFCLSLGSLWLYDLATTSDYFNTKHVEVYGNVRLSKQMVKDYAGVHEGDNCLDVSISKVEQELLKTPWVKSVSVKRVLPDKFVIKLHERMPSFWVKKNGVLFYADERGNLIAPVETKNFMSLPTLEIGQGAEATAEHLAYYLEDLKSGILPVEYGAISAFRLSADKGIELYLDDREIRLCLAPDGWKNNLKRLSITLGDLVRRNELSKVREIRATDGNVWVITNT